MKNALFFLVIIMLAACGAQPISPPASPHQTTIAISWFYPNSNYQNWLSLYQDSLMFVNVYALEDSKVDSVLANCDGYILSGGCDVDPKWFGQASDVSRCGELDDRRDSLEMLMITRSFEHKIPLLGVCRGLQLMNIHAGGSLVIDLPSDRQTTMHQQAEGDAKHELWVLENTKLYELVGCLAGEVNCNHHQAIDRLGEGYRVEALSPDSVIEAIWWTDTLNHPFALGIQWHAERLQQRNPFAGKIGRGFLSAVNN